MPTILTEPERCASRGTRTIIEPCDRKGNSLNLRVWAALFVVTTTLMRPHHVFGQNDLAPAEIFAPMDWPAATEMRTASGAPGPAYWQQRADYTIEATLDVENRRIEAKAQIVYTNNSPHTLDFIWFQLEQNLFRDDSLGASVNEGLLSAWDEPGFEGGYDIHAVRVGTTASELKIYDTLARLDLPAPLAAGSKIRIDIEWSYNIPQDGDARTGWEEVGQGTIFEIAQWFPCIAKYDDTHAWNTLPFLSAGEFYTDFGTYDVKITVPRSHIVVATGELQNATDVLTRRQTVRLNRARMSDNTVMIRDASEVDDPASRPGGNGPLTWHFEAEDVRTFAWASSDAFIWDASGYVGTLVQSVYPVEAKTWTRSTEMLRACIKQYSEKWYPYPYPVATNVNGPVYGMEYPMILFCAAREDEVDLFLVTTHEIGHNWVPMLVNTDERRHAWMDEGFNEFMNLLSYREWAATQEGWDPAAMDPDWIEIGDELPIDTHPIMTYADRYHVSDVGWLAYSKPSHGLVLLRDEILGAERFDDAFRAYFKRWAYKSPRPADFFRTMEDVSGVDLAWFWRGWFAEVAWLDFSVGSVEDELVSIESSGDLVLPCEVEITMDDGSTMRREIPVEGWSITREWNVYFPTDGKTITRVEIDPDIRIPDSDRENNVWTRS